MSTAPRQLRATEPTGPQRSPAADADSSITLSGVSALPAWSDSPRQLKQGWQMAQLQAAAAPATPAQGGLPQGLRQGIESLSGLDMADVRVHRNSSKPAAMQAHAYAQGQDIHLGPGQQQHLPHEAWHVVQQAQGRVRPTSQLKGGVPINEDKALELEADAMGAKASSSAAVHQSAPLLGQVAPDTTTAPIQRIRIKLNHANDPIMNNVRAARVPRPGERTVDGLNDYQPEHAAIGDDEAIVLEGHGTYLNADHAPDAPYDSQAQLGPRELANVAFMIPKSERWHGQIILFGCATGPLTLEVSRHYHALTGQSINVVGTLADIRMELPDERIAEHHAEYDEVEGRFPRSTASISARGRYLKWLIGGQKLVESLIDELLMLRESMISDYGTAVEGAKVALQGKMTMLAQLPGQQLTYVGGVWTERNIATVGEMSNTGVESLLLFLEAMASRDAEPIAMDDEAEGLLQFLVCFRSALDDFERMAMADARTTPEGTVDWEGENVLNSMAEESDGLPREPLGREYLRSDQWGGGEGGQVLTMTMPIEGQFEDDF
ncbi:DUF4157 domain-containing protein [Paucibacter sp. DJ1R-11]|uniref:eCIS core domain-containing protein n=1 Tax=Paucibacter sp. DJ1R-11 TaxID=2893556 RepID=UPI0021E3A9BD|nr:DUF4157 domain-containing protein [Paucibacter sp. DJ1R-11]MCV2363930.1 DUF4157 domain-containing protein [Paucibacter sp. DJ1R-11]